MQKIIFTLPFFILLFSCHGKTKMVIEKNYTTPEEEMVLMYAISKDSFVVNKIPKPVTFKVKNSSTISFEVNTMMTDGFLCKPVINIHDSVIYVSYRSEPDSTSSETETKVSDLIYPVTLVYQITDLKPLEKNYKVLFTYPQK